jgi:hypothetical protein
MGALGVVLAVRIAGDVSRPRWMRGAAIAASTPLALGAYLAFSRGALVALAIGLALLVLLDASWEQLRAVGLAVVAAVVVCLAADSSDGVRALQGDLGDREAAGAAVLGLLAVMAAAAAAVHLWLGRRHQLRPLPGRARGALAIGLGIAAVGGFAFAAVTTERRPADAATGATASRLASTQSDRAEYWRVAAEMFADDPLRGAGSGAFGTVWLRERDEPKAVRDAHSLYIETAAELGLVGLIALGLFLGGVAWSGVRAYARDPVLATGLVAGLAVWAVHAGLDWLWEVPTVTAIALLLASGLVRASYGETGGASSRTRRSAAAAPAGS